MGKRAPTKERRMPWRHQIILGNIGLPTDERFLPGPRRQEQVHYMQQDMRARPQDWRHIENGQDVSTTNSISTQRPHAVTAKRQEQQQLLLTVKILGRQGSAEPVAIHISRIDVWSRRGSDAWCTNKDSESEAMIKQAVYVMFKNPQPGDILMDAPRSNSWRELCTYACDRDYWRARVRALRQPRVTTVNPSRTRHDNLVQLTPSY